MDDVQKLLLELDKLKSIYRRCYLSDLSRKENSAEHSWYLSLALLILNQTLNLEIDIHHAVKMALVHDIGEIGAGDISVYDSQRSDQANREDEYLSELASQYQGFTQEIYDLWSEYEKQESPESRWVKVVDRLLPFLLNLSTEGKSWQEQGVKRSQVLEINRVIAEEAPDIYQWMTQEINQAVERGWLQE